MPATEQVAIEWITKFDQLEKDLAKFDEIGAKGAKALVGQLSRELKGAEKAAKEAGKASKEAFAGVGDAAGSAGSTAKKLRGILGSLSPDLAVLAGGVDDVADAMEIADGAGTAMGISAGRLAALLGGITIALGGAYLAYRVLSEEMERSTAIAAAVEKSNRALEPVFRAERDALLDLDLATGKVSESQAELIRIQGSAMDAWRKSTAETRGRITELREEQGSLTTTVVDGAMAVTGQIAAWRFLQPVLDGLTTDSAELQEEIDGLQGTMDRATTATVGTVAAQRKAAEAKRGHKAAADDLKSTLASLNAEMDEENDLAGRNAETYQQVLDSLNQAEDASRRAMMTADERAAAEHAAAQVTLAAERDKALAVADSVGARETVERAYLDAMTAEQSAYNAAQQKAYDANVAQLRDTLSQASAEADAWRSEQRAAAQTMAVDAAMEMANAVGSVASTLADRFADNAAELQETLDKSGKNLTKSERAELKARIADQQQAALKAFRISQGLDIAAATMSATKAALAGLAAGLALGPAGLVIGPATAAAAAATGVASVAQIASQSPPSFGDTPGVMEMGNNGNVRLAGGDHFAAARTPEALRAQVNGPSSSPAVLLFRHQAFDAGARQSLQAGVLRRSAQSATRPGRR